MQKWLPDDFGISESAVAAVVHPDDSIFESDVSAASSDVTENSRLFLSESGFSGPEAIMAHLTPEERAQVFELVEQDITKVYEERENDLRAKMDDDLKIIREGFDSALSAWSQDLHQAMATHMKETADASARMAVKIAEKIIRQKINLDHDILVRAMETALFKIDGDKNVIVNLNPLQAEWLETQAGVKEKLGIQQIVADRRIEAGGCVVKTEKQEWDATISSQLEYLSEIVEEMITTGDEPELSAEDGTDAEPSLD